MDDQDKEIYARIADTMVQLTAAANRFTAGVSELVGAISDLTGAVRHLERSQNVPAE